MSVFFYYFITFLESALAAVGIRPFEQPRYTVVARLERGVEIRDYVPGTAVETEGTPGDGEAFERLFRYITGHNDGRQMIAMTAPVATRHARIAMTLPLEHSATGVMRFFLPENVARAGPPEPDDPSVHIVTLPRRTVAALRFSGKVTQEVIARQDQILNEVLEKNGRKTEGEPFLLGYDPPFTIPFLRRNEVAVMLSPD